MKFLTDEMHGDITKWLRILGYDTKYAKDYEPKYGSPVDDNNLMEESLSEFRILITRDQGLFNKITKRFNKLIENNPEMYQKFEISELSRTKNEIKFPFILLENDDLIENVAKISDKFGIRLNYDPKLARCSKCNAKLIKILKKDSIKEEIPDLVYKSKDEFWQCSNEKCNKFYWIGGHFKRIFAQLQKIQDKKQL